MPVCSSRATSPSSPIARLFRADYAQAFLVAAQQLGATAFQVNVPWHRSRITEQPVTLDKAAQIFGQEVRLPRWVPQGYQMAALDIVEPLLNPTNKSQRWLRATYDDGALPLFVLQGPPEDALAAGGAASSQQVVLKADRATYWERAPWILLEGSIEGRSMMLLGRLELLEAQRVLDSAR